MRIALTIIAAIALIGTIAPAVLYLADVLSKDTMQWWMLAATIAWFATIPFCGRTAKQANESEAAGAK